MEHTDKGGRSGTYLSDVPPALNRYFDWFIWDGNTSSETQLINRAVDDTYYVGTALQIGVQAGVLPWWRQHGASGLHAITVYGYYMNGGGGLNLADPWNQTWAGYHNLDAHQTFLAMNGNNRGMAW